LDNTDIHPDQYELAKYIESNLKSFNKNIEQFFEENKEKLKQLYPDV
jgi:transcriptional accessory protein Tex/SPT6